jgi:hypothetical protein
VTAVETARWHPRQRPHRVSSERSADPFSSVRYAVVVASPDLSRSLADLLALYADFSASSAHATALTADRAHLSRDLQVTSPLAGLRNAPIRSEADAQRG